MRRIALIVNPFASNVDDERLGAVERALSTAGDVELATFRTERRAHATELAREACAGGVDAVVVFSGDGGFNEVLNGVDGACPVGFLPGGGTSVLPRALGLPRDPADAAAQVAAALREGRTRRISLGRVNGRRFAFSAGIGFDGELVRRVDALGRALDGRRPGDLAFVRETLRTIAAHNGRWQPALELDGFGRAAFVLVANTHTYTYAGALPIRVAPEAEWELGLDVVAPVSVRKRLLPWLVAYVTTGRGQVRARDVHYGHDLDRIEVACDHPMPLQADGEDLGDVTQAVFEAERGAVAVLV